MLGKVEPNHTLMASPRYTSPERQRAVLLTGTDTVSALRTFKLCIGHRLSMFNACLRHLVSNQTGKEYALTRPLLSDLHADAAQLEEMLDAYGARNNAQWFAFRERIAATKAFADIGYKLLHLLRFHSSYQLRGAATTFAKDTRDVLKYVQDVLTILLRELQTCALELAIASNHSATARQGEFDEVVPPGRLPYDRKARHVESAQETVIRLASAFLHLGAESDILHIETNVDDSSYSMCVPDPINEAAMRDLEYRFHNLQSQYDTYVSDTDQEHHDPNLILLRGHITTVFHLLELATAFVHFYERHILEAENEVNQSLEYAVDSCQLLHHTFRYCLAYAARYVDSGRKLCQHMLRTYAKIERALLPVPRYRGFHVRPSTLIARIVRHYGLEVSVELMGERYDASIPMELFRANEVLNAEKRKHIADAINQLQLQDRKVQSAGQMTRQIRNAVLQLAEQNKLVIYEHPLDLEQLPHPGDDESFGFYLTEAIARLMALGKIDSESKQTVAFIGDRRVLQDIRILAQHGYGEDRLGHNIPLPPQLSYLHR